VPVVSRRGATRSAPTAINLEGSWSADNGYGCVVIRMSDAGSGVGGHAPFTPKKLDYPVYLRIKPSECAKVERSKRFHCLQRAGVRDVNLIRRMMGADQ
jgi:hypothetical protein